MHSVHLWLCLQWSHNINYSLDDTRSKDHWRIVFLHNLARAKRVLDVITWSYTERKWGVRPGGAGERLSGRSGFGGRFSRVILSYFQVVTHKGTRLLLSLLTGSVFFQGQQRDGFPARSLGQVWALSQGRMCCLSNSSHTKGSLSAQGGDTGRWHEQVWGNKDTKKVVME